MSHFMIELILFEFMFLAHHRFHFEMPDFVCVISYAIDSDSSLIDPANAMITYFHHVDITYRINIYFTR